ncbi:MAG: signal recognition particle-docking protein FtsY [Sphaerochaetaceae bacterium]
MVKSFASRLKSLFGIKQLDEQFFEDLEQLLIEGDLGAKLTFELSDVVRQEAKNNKITTLYDLQLLMKKQLGLRLNNFDVVLKEDKTNIFLILGVNGVGKTTTIAKLAHYYKNQNKSVVLAAGDTFRAAAIDQLDLHAQRVGCRIIKHGPNSDPAAVIFDAIESAKSKKENLILADTAGRMHNKEHLLRQLQKIDKIITAKIDNDATYNKFLVLDATTGQNGLSQSHLFNQAIGVDAIILAKYDSSSKGGTLIQIGDQQNIPIAFIGDGESYDKLAPFNKEHFLNALVGISQ